MLAVVLGTIQRSRRVAGLQGIESALRGSVEILVLVGPVLVRLYRCSSPVCGPSSIRTFAHPVELPGLDFVLRQPAEEAPCSRHR